MEINADYKTKVESLLFGLDDINNDLMLTFRSAYITFSTNPCENDKYLAAQIEKITFEHNRLKRYRLQINSLIDMLTIPNNESSELIMRTYCDIVDEMSLNGECQKETITQEMRSSIEDVKRLSSGGNNER